MNPLTTPTALPTALALAAATLCAAGFPAAAADAEEILGVDPDRRSGFYVSGFGGVAFGEEVEVDNTIQVVDDGPEVEGFLFDLDDAPVFGTAFGFTLGQLRAEAELSYAEAEASLGFREARSGVASDVSYLNAMMNVLYDQPIVGPLDLYLGGGLGVSFVRLNLPGEVTFEEIGADGERGGRLSSSDGDMEAVIAAQVLAGLSLRVHERLAITGGYRGVFTDNANLGGFDLDGSFRSSLEAGLRITF